MTAFLVLLTGISLVLSLLLTPVCRAAALRWNLVDVPDSSRKIHRHPIPRIGGVAVVLAYFGSCLLVAAVSAHNGAGAYFAFSAAKSVAPAAVMVFLVGLADDILGLKPWHKLVGILAAAVVVSTGVHIRAIAGFPLPPWLGAVGTIVWLVVCANALNLIDGVDGLAAGIALLACGTTIAAALLGGHIELAVATVPLAGALLGFLVFNFNPASIFLGDSGSLVLGFLLGCFGILWSEKSATILGMTAPLIALAIPLLDTSLAIARRFLRRQAIFKADRSHIHHRLLAQGLSARRVVLLLYMATGIAGVLSLFLSRVRDPWEGVIVVVIFVCGTIFGVQQLGYVEFGAARHLALHGAFRRILNAQLAVQSFEERLSAAVTPQECWAAIQSASKDFGFHQIEMQFGGHTYEYHNGVGPIRSWAIRISISEEDWVELSHEFGPFGYSTAVAAFAETIRKVLEPRSFVFARSGQQARAYSAIAY